MHLNRSLLWVCFYVYVTNSPASHEIIYNGAFHVCSMQLICHSPNKKLHSWHRLKCRGWKGCKRTCLSETSSFPCVIIHIWGFLMYSNYSRLWSKNQLSGIRLREWARFLKCVLSKPIICRFNCWGKVDKRCDSIEGRSMTGAVGGAPDGGWGWVVALGAALVQMQVERSMALTMPDVNWDGTPYEA